MFCVLFQEFPELSHTIYPGMRLIAQWHIEDENQADYPVDQPQDIYTQLSRESSAAGNFPKHH